MIKYVKIKGFSGLGEAAYMGSHLYQWIQQPIKRNPKKVKTNYGAIVLIRAYETETPTVWHGYILNETKAYINNARVKDFALKEVKETIGNYKVVKDLKEFLAGHQLAENFAEYVEKTWHDIKE